MLIDHPWIWLGTVMWGVSAAVIRGCLAVKSLNNHRVPHLQAEMALTGTAIAVSVPITYAVTQLVSDYAGDTPRGPTSTGEIFGLRLAALLIIACLPNLGGILHAGKRSPTRQALVGLARR